MTKKTFLTIAMVFLGLLAGTNTAWADEETPEGQPFYLAAFKAEASPVSTGSGSVKLTWIDAQGALFANPMASFLNDPEQMPSYASGNPSNGDTFDSDAMVVGATLTATESVEDSNPNSFVNKTLRNLLTGSQTTPNLFMTPFAYFKADAEGANGSYFVEWTFNDSKIMRQDTAMDKSHPESAYYKVLPNSANVFYMVSSTQITGLNGAYTGAVTAPNTIYAVFKKFILSNPIAASGSLDATPDATATLNVSVDVEGDVAQLKEAYADFAFPATTFADDTEGTWTWAHAATPSENISATKKRYHFVVTYTAKSGVTVGTHKATLTIGMQGAAASVLNISLSVNALNPARPEATWFDGKTEKDFGDLTDMLDVDITSYTNPILRLNRPVLDDLTFSEKDFTLDLNGNSTQAITISSGNVTIAYSKYGGDAISLTVNGGKAILNGGTFGSLTIANGATVEQNGATITGATTNAGTLTTTDGVFQSGLTSTNSLVLNGGEFRGTTAITISGGTAAINRGTIEGTACGLKVTDGTATVKKLAAIKGGTYSAQQTGGTLTIECGKFDGALNGTIDFTSGYFKTNNYGVPTTGKNEMLVSVGVEYNEGYRYFLGTAEAAVANGAGVCRIGNVSYATLEEALAYANNKPSEEVVIFMTNDYTLPAGYYTLPAKATLVVPMSDEQAKEVNLVAPRITFNDIHSSHPYTENIPTEFRCLTFASGVNMEVFGDIEVTCTQLASNEAYTSQPVGPYGRLVLAPGSYMTLQSGSHLRAWGFITGDGSVDGDGIYLSGEIDARRGATVYEMFQLGDWKGATTSVAITGMMGDENTAKKKIFPVSQYFIQNIESPVKYHPGAVLSTSAAVSEGIQQFGGISVTMNAPDIKIVGVSGTGNQAIFLMDIAADADNTWVRKWYDVKNDVQTYDINSGAHIGSMVLDMGNLSLAGYNVPVQLNSAKFDLPITNNFKIHLLTGTMDFLQNTSLLPGAEVEVDKEATVSVAMSNDEYNAKKKHAEWVAGGQEGEEPELPEVFYTGALYVYDAADWDQYAYCNEYRNGSMVSGTAYTKIVRHSPSWENKGTTQGQPDVRSEQEPLRPATINVHGTFNTATGFVYTSGGGANIFSTNADAGTFIFNQNASEAEDRDVWNVYGSSSYQSKKFYPARLKNGVADPEYVNTDTASAGDAYCYMDDKWTIMKNEDCFVKDNYDVYYAKPSEYVALANGTTENEDHTYSDKAGTGRLFILAQGEAGDKCQWWEVEKKDNLYHCIHPQNDTYYEWESNINEETGVDEGEWKEKRFNITWKNWDGTIIETADEDGTLHDSYKVPYGTVAEFLGTNPTREAKVDYTYDFTGWSPALDSVKSDVTYTATYTQKPRTYTIIFLNEGGVEIERQFLTLNEWPVCENAPTKVGHTLEWTPAIAAVTGEATYTAKWLEEAPEKYEITFFDYDGKEILQQDSVNVGETPEKPATPTGKTATDEFTYVFDHWSPDVEPVSIDGPKSYTAVYREVAKKYTVIFQNEDGSEIERHKYSYGETPVCSATPTKENTPEWTYQLIWKPQIQTVMGDATYKADFETLKQKNKYTVTLKANPSGACTFTGAGTFDYNTTVNNVTVSYDEEQYEFQGWSDLTGDAKMATTHAAFTLTEDITIVADFRYKGDDKVTITWKNWNGGDLGTSEPKVNAATTFIGATPTREASESKTYTFYGWYTKNNEGDTLNIYKNGMTPKAAGNATYYAYFNEEVRKYTISWKNENGADIEVDYNQPYGAVIEYNSATPTKSPDALYSYTFDDWTESNGDVVTLPATVTGNAVFYAHFNAVSVVPVVEETLIEAGGEGDAEVTINNPVEADRLIVHEDGKVTVTATATATVDEFIIESNGTNSGEVIGAANITAVDAYFDLEMEMDALTWYAVAVPWEVDATNGIIVNGSPLRLVTDIDVLYYDGASRAANGTGAGINNWKYVAEQGDKTLYPGTLYMIYLANPTSKIRFQKKAGADVLTTTLSVHSYASTTGSDIDAGWNGIANPSLFHAFINANADTYYGDHAAHEQYWGQKYIPAQSRYDGINMKEEDLIVGEPVFVQVEADKDNVVAETTNGSFAAPRRRAPRVDNAYYEVHISAGEAYTDRIYLQTLEDKEDRYVIGLDLAKAGVSNKVAQMWVNRYNAKLCVNTTAPVGKTATYPLGISIPENGTYQISSATEMQNNQELYVTRNGNAIWNLAYGPYTLTLDKGTYSEYGIKLIQSNAPAVTTGVDQTTNDKLQIQKVVIDNHVYIVREGELYTITGQKVK